MTSAREAFLRSVTDAMAEDGGLVLEKAVWTEESLCLSLAVKREDGVTAHTWNVQAARTIEERLASEWAESVYLGRDHPALIPFQEPECDIYFTESSVSAKELLGITSIACATALGKWHAASDFLNNGLGLAEGRCGAHGLLGRFPKRVASRIMEELANTSIRPVLLNERPPVLWDKDRWVPYSHNVEVLVFGNSFVIGEAFTFDAA